MDDNNTDCFKVGSFEIIVKFFPAITEPAPLVLCDDLGEENDGITAFDLTVRNSEITNGDLTLGVSYFETEDDALGNINRIDPETAYINQSNPQVLYVRVKDGTLVPPVFSSPL